MLDLYKIKYSQLRLLKVNCKNLEVLAISMVMGLKRVMMSATQIQVKEYYIYQCSHIPLNCECL